MRPKYGMANVIARSALVLAVSIAAASQSVAQTPGAESQKVVVVVTDENGVAVSGARVQLQNAAAAHANSFRCETDFSGHCEFAGMAAGAYDLRVEKGGFYTSSLTNVQAGNVQASATANIDVTLSHQQAVREVVDVVASGPAIDPAQIAAEDELTGTEMVDIPYPGPHDYHGALNFIPGVTPDGFGQLHVAGAEGYQTLVLLDGFNVSQPTNGQLAVRTSIESFRSLEVIPSREPAELGKGSGGVVGLNTGMGRDQYRFTSTDFVPAVWTTQGRLQAQWTPIDTFSGPIIKGKAWFIDALDGEFDDNVDTSLPVGKDRDYVWRADNLAKVQGNLTNRNIVTASFLSNYYHDKYSGLGFLVPQTATPTQVETAYFGSLKDQYYFHNGTLLETGFGVTQYDTTLRPQGNLPYIQLFFSAAGNYYLHEDARARRTQAITNLYLPPQEWLGRHDFKVGFDVDRLSYNAQFLRQPISFEQQGAPEPGQTVLPCKADGNGVPVVPATNCTRYSTFSGGTFAPTYSAEGSVYAEDRWLITNRLLIEPGLRLDWDELVSTPLLSPRLAGTFRLDGAGTTKLSAGIGIVYDATNLGLIHQPLEGQRVDYFFDSNGCPQQANGQIVPCNQPPPAQEPAAIPVPTTFVVNRNSLQAPRYINASVSLEKKLPFDTLLKIEAMDKRGTHAFTYNTLNSAVDGIYLLGNHRDDRYHAVTVSLRHRFHGHYEIFGAYTRSRARSNQIFDFSLDIPLLSPQLAGPYPWDTPNRFVGWGVLPGPSLPVVHKFDIVWSAEARTGLPYYGTTDQGEIAAGFPPSESLHLPAYYTLNLQVEKRVHLFGRLWAGRIGFNNITNRPNFGVISNIDSTHPAPTFFNNNGGRAFALRLMLLGKDQR